MSNEPKRTPEQRTAYLCEVCKRPAATMIRNVEAERDEAIRRNPCEAYPWDGVGEVRPFRAMQETIVEGVY